MNRFLTEPRIAAYEALFGREHVKAHINGALEDARAIAREAQFETLCADVLERLERSAFDLLVPVINGTGVILHTNLGRAPLAGESLAAVLSTARGYSNLEYDLAQGGRGTRYARATAVLQSVTGAQDALLVNNCAAAVLLILDTFAKDREVIVARSQLVEIGGGFRIPDVLRRSGATLVEAGATNKVYLRDYERALTPRTALFLRCHPSNYRISGFTNDVEPRDLAALARRTGVPLVEDLGSGALVDLREYGLPHERTAQEALADGVDLVAFSADKLLGGPQTGVILGKSALIARLRANPLLRALRVDKMAIAALAQTLRLYATPELRKRIPLFAMLEQPLEHLRARAATYARRVQGVTSVESIAYVGAGSLPESGLPSVAVALTPSIGADAAAAALRRASTPIVARIEGGRLLLDLRTILVDQDDGVIAALQALPSNAS